MSSNKIESTKHHSPVATGIDLVDAFEKALLLPTGDVGAYARKVYPTNPHTCKRLIEMVKHHREAELAIRTAGGQQDDQPRIMPERIRDYAIAGIIGEGGMSIVYLGRRDVLGTTQSVAIKVDGSAIGSMDAQRRFLSERSILAGIDHPFIAQIFDWGNDEDGRSFQVMEFINGLPIDEYVSTKQLSQSDTISLLRKVCTAVEASHQNLVIHRDIKPNNILVTHDGLPKIIDFGIAKQLDQSDQTIAGQLAFTPAYASPEQIKGEQLTTATDVYSLGIVIYKLFCNQLPYDISTMSWRESQDFVADVQITFPPGLDSDLRTIISTALQSDTDKRYHSVAELHEDLRNYQENRPINARAVSIAYRVKKFVTRNVALSTAFVIGTLAVGTTLSVSLWQTQRAQTQLVRAEKVTKFLSDLLVAPSPSIEASYQLSPQATLGEILARAEKELATDETIPWDIRVELLNSISHSHMWMEEEQSAIRSQAISLKIAEAHRFDDARAMENYVLALSYMAETYENALDFPRAIKLYALADEVGSASQVTINKDWLNILNNYAFTLARANRWDEAAAIQTRVINDSTSVLGTKLHPSKVIYYKNMGQIHLELGHFDESRRYLEQALSAYNELDRQDPYTLLKLKRVYAWLKYLRGDLSEAASIYDSTRQIDNLNYSYAFADQAIDRVQAARIRLELGENIEQQISIISQVSEVIQEFTDHPESWPYHFARATALRMTQRPNESLLAAERALNFAKHNGATNSEVKAISQLFATP